jgi:hypothetical protein
MLLFGCKSVKFLRIESLLFLQNSPHSSQKPAFHMQVSHKNFHDTILNRLFT